MNLSVDIYLPPPGVPLALPPDNLLPYEALEISGMTVLINAISVRPGDRIDLYWMGCFYQSILVDPDSTHWPVEMLIGKEMITTDGLFELRYYLVSISGEAQGSDVIFIKVDRSRPNAGNIPGAIIFPEEIVTHGISEQYLLDNNDQVVATTPAYSNLEAGQLVSVYWNANAIPKITVTEQDVQSQHVPVIFSGDFIRQHSTSNALVGYHLTSRAGYDGERSEPTLIQVNLEPKPEELPPPVIPLALGDGLIDLDDANIGVVVEISEYTNWDVQDFITAFWGNIPFATEPVSGAFPMRINVSRATVVDVGSGDILVGYQVTRGNERFDSPLTTVFVDVETVGPEDPNPETPINENLPPPLVSGGSGLGGGDELVPNDIDMNAIVFVPFYDNAMVGEIITVLWGGAEKITHIITDDEIFNSQFDGISVPQGIIAQTPDSPKWPVSYFLSRPIFEQPPENAIQSLIGSVNIHMREPGGSIGLLPAEFPDVTPSGWFLYESVVNGVRVHINAYENMRLGDVINITWQAYAATNGAPETEISGTDFTDSLIVNESNLSGGLDFLIPYKTYVEPIQLEVPSAQGAGIVNYSVTPAGYLSSTAAPESLVKIDLFLS